MALVWEPNETLPACELPTCKGLGSEVHLRSGAMTACSQRRGLCFALEVVLGFRISILEDKGGFKVNSGTVYWPRSSYGTDFDNSEIASPEILPKTLVSFWQISYCTLRCGPPRLIWAFQNGASFGVFCATRLKPKSSKPSASQGLV